MVAGDQSHGLGIATDYFRRVAMKMLVALGKLLTSVSWGAVASSTASTAVDCGGESGAEAAAGRTACDEEGRQPGGGGQRAAAPRATPSAAADDVSAEAAAPPAAAPGPVQATPDERVATAASLEKENLNLHRHSVYHQRMDKLAFRLHGVLTAEECGQLIATSEANGYSPVSEYRDAHCWQSEALAERLWQALKSHVPADIWGCSVVGISERFFMYRDAVGFQCSEYYDEVYERSGDKAVSFVSVWIDLNQDFDGGRLVFMKRTRPGALDVVVEPRTGSATILQHNILYQKISAVAKGTKYTLRTDVMYSSSKQRSHSRSSYP